LGTDYKSAPAGIGHRLQIGASGSWAPIINRRQRELGTDYKSAPAGVGHRLQIGASEGLNFYPEEMFSH
jgi:hypothetical protein